MIVYKMHLLRTGSTSDGVRARYVGQSDLPLSGTGLAELRLLREQFAYPPAEMVFTSPLRRCVQTAEILYPNTLTETAGNFIDMNLGAFEGKSYEELIGDERFDLWMKDSVRHAPPGGEQADAFKRRIVEGVYDIFTRMMEEGTRSVAVITHAGVIMTLLAGIGLPKRPLPQWAVGNGMGYTLLFTPQMWMRDGCAEVFCPQPQPSGGGDSEF